MASILRGFRYPLGYFAGFARSLALNSGGRPIDGATLVQPTQCFCGNYNSNAFATAASPAPNSSLERSLRRLDQDVKRIGRISRRDIEDVLEEIKSNRSATSSQSLLVIRCCGNLVPEELPETRTALVLEIWKTLNSLNIPMDISHYNALLRVYLENEHQFSPSEFLADLEAKGIEPNRVTYQRLIARYCQQGDIEGATKILEFMREKQLPVNENVFNALIMGHSQAGDMDSAVGILSVMKQAGLSPSNDTYTTLLCGYAKEGNIDAIKSTLETCDKAEIYFMDRDILEIVYNLAINGHAEHVDFLIERIRKSAGYNQDAINVILRLVNKGHEDTALKILITMPRGVRQDGEFADTGSFMIRQMVRSGRSLEGIVKVCKYLEENQLNSRALLIAVETAISCNSDATPALLKEIKAAGHQLRQHYFWPLICSAKDQNALLDVLKMMQDVFQLPPNGETIREYVIPNLKAKNYDSMISLLSSAGISMSNCATSTAYQALMDQNLSEAARIVSSYRCYYAPGLYRKPLLQAFNKSKDLDAYTLFVRHLYENLSRSDSLNSGQKSDAAAAETEGVNEEENASNKAEILGQIVYDAVAYFQSNRAQVIQQILNELVKQGLAISNGQATRIQEKMGAELTPEISEMLGKLSTGELEPTPLERPDRPKLSIQDMDSERLESLIASIEAKGDNPKGMKRQLIATLIREKNATKLEQLITKLEAEGFVLTNGVLAQIADMYAAMDNLEKAIETIEKVKAKDPDFALDRLKAIRIAQLYLARDQTDACLKFLDAHKKSEIEVEGFNYNTTCWRLLNSVAEKGQPQLLQQIFDKLVEFKYFEPNNVLLGPLIKVHLVKDDITEAMKTFETIVEKYRVTPWKNELACRLIQKEDPTNLQKLTDLSASIHGEVNSLYDLVFSFVECGRIRQARKILETPGLRTRAQRINIACERYRNEGMVEPLEGLVEATKDLKQYDRMEIYYNLLLSYIKDKQPDKALGLWTKLQEENITPSDPFLTKLSGFLKQNKMDVPFVVPESVKKSAPKTEEKIVKIEKQEVKAPPPPKEKPVVERKLPTASQDLRRALRTGDVEGALAARAKVPNPTVTELSLLSEVLIKAERLNEATRVVYEILDQNATPVLRIFKFFLNKLAASGDIETMDQIEHKLTPEVKKLLSFDNRLCYANIVAGKTEQYLAKLEADIDNAKTPEEIAKVSERFPRGGAIGILEKKPELTEKFEQIAEKYASKRVLAPMNILWCQYFIENKDKKAEQIWTKYLANEPRLMFQRVSHVARDKNDAALAKKLITKLHDAKITDGAIGNAYSCLIDVLAATEKFDEGVKVIEEASKNVGLDTINRTALQRIKDGVEKTGQKVSFVIPERTRKAAEPEDTSSSSSSSSDDEVTKKTKRE